MKITEIDKARDTLKNPDVCRASPELDRLQDVFDALVQIALRLVDTADQDVMVAEGHVSIRMARELLGRPMSPDAIKRDVMRRFPRIPLGLDLISGHLLGMEETD